MNRGLIVEQARKLLVTAHGDRLYALYVLVLYLGLRRGELLGLRREDVGLDRGVPKVRRPANAAHRRAKRGRQGRRII